jgi:hypothetical protein
MPNPGLISRLIPSTVLAGCLAATFSVYAPGAYAQSGVPTQTVVTVMPKNANQPASVSESQLQASIDGKRAQVTSFTPLTGERSGLQMVVLIDSSARASVTLQFNDLKNFIRSLPEGAQVGVAYMQNGRAVITQNITPDHNLAANALAIPNGVPGATGSPYFCLSDLVKNWPSGATTDRREVLMITDGVDLYYGRTYDPNDPYVQSAITDSQRAGVLVHSIFYRDAGRFDSGQWTEAGAQNYLQQVSQATGGRAYWQGFGNPVSFVPFLDDLHKRLANQYELGLLVSPKNKASLQPLKLKVTAPGTKVDAPQMILVPGSESASR